MKNLLPLLAVLLASAACGLVGYAQEPDPNFYIYLCFGQSNMEGAGEIEEIDRTNVPERFKMMAAVDYTSPKREMYQWYTATPPLVRQTSGLCPVDWFGRTMIDNLPDNVRVGVIVVAVGGAGIQHLDKDYDVTTLKNEASWFQSFMHAYNDRPYQRLVDCAREAQKSGVIKGILLHQGETNNGDSQWCKNVKKVYTDLLTDLSLEAEDVPLFVGETVRSEMGGACGWHNINAIPHIPEVIPTGHIVSSEGLDDKGDGLHFTSHSYRVLGGRYAVEALKLMGIDKPIVNYTESGMSEPEAYPVEGDYVFDMADFNPSIWGEGKYSSKLGVFVPGEWGCGGWEYPDGLDLSSYQYIVAVLKQAQTNSAQLRVWDTQDYFDKSFEREFGNKTLLVSDLKGMMKNLDTGITPLSTDHITRVGIWAAGGGKIHIEHIYATNNDPYNPAGVTDVEVGNDGTYTVYNLQGICLLDHGTYEAYRALPPSLYIVNGAKVLICD